MINKNYVNDDEMDILMRMHAKQKYTFKELEDFLSGWRKELELRKEKNESI